MSLIPDPFTLDAWDTVAGNNPAINAPIMRWLRQQLHRHPDGGTLGVGDCERIRDGWLAQPSNALSSLAYVVAGADLARRAWRRPAGGRRRLALTYAVAVMANGPGGVAYHGPGGPGGAWLHDAAVVATLATMATVDLEAIGGREPAVAPAIVAAGIGALVLAAVPELSTGTQLALAGVVGALELALAVRPAAGSLARRARLLAPVAGFAVAGAVHATSRTGRRWCDPDGWLQGHAAWHVLSAAALWWWGRERT